MRVAMETSNDPEDTMILVVLKVLSSVVDCLADNVLDVSYNIIVA